MIGRALVSRSDRAARPGAVLFLTVVLTAGCSSSGEVKTVTPAAWAAGVCRQIVSWQERTGSVASDLPEQVEELTDDLPEARQHVVDAVDQMLDATDRMIDGVEDAGTPDTAQGPPVAERLRTGLRQAKDELDKARTEATELSVENPATFERGVDDIQAAQEVASDRIEQAQDSAAVDFEAPDLDAAIENEPDCRKIATRGDTPAAEWAGRVCDGIVSWQNELQRLGLDLQTQIRGLGRDLNAARARLVEFMTQIVASTDRLLAGTEGAGAPDVRSGDQVARDLGEGLGQVRQVFEEARVTAENLAVDDPGAFSAGAEELTAKIRSARDRIREAFQNLDTAYDVPELDRAFAGAAACREVQG